MGDDKMRLNWKGDGRIISGPLVLEWHCGVGEMLYNIFSLNKKPDENPILSIRVFDGSWQHDMPTDFYNDIQR